MNKATYIICIPHAEEVEKALRAELGQPAPQKGRVRIRVEDGCLVIEIESPTLSGLRALSNSFLYLAHAAYSSLEATSSEPS
ncbi:MAG: hypothetical protein F7C08_03400 [Desulfurococcales archaeon]|nr:hypothetical protein [Desulfurococcales archaeon]MCE4605559.1 hypothetical protein [Desulfurococcales archaeon]